MSSGKHTTPLQDRLSMYSLAAGSVAALAAGNASAVVVDVGTSGTPLVSATGDANNTVDIDIDGDGQNDFQIEVISNNLPAHNGAVHIRGLANTFNTSGQNSIHYGGSCGSGYAGNLAAGTPFNATNPTLNWGETTVQIRTVYQTCNFTDNTWGYLGLRFVNASGTHYAHLRIRNRTGSIYVDLEGGAYGSTADEEIVVGAQEVKSVPVGGAVPLGLSLMAIGAAALRRRERKSH